MKTILVVDDSAICREPMTVALKHYGYHAIGAGSGAEALAILPKCRPDLILLDLVMPEMDGWAVLQKLRAIPGHQDTPVILLTATADRDHVLKAREHGIRDYLLKSHFSLSEMLERVKRKVGAPGTTGPSPAALEKPAKPSSAPTGAQPVNRSTRPAESLQPRGPKATLATNAKAPLAAVGRLTREETIQRIEECTNGKTLAGVVAEVVAIASSPRTSAGDLSQALKRDPVLTTRVIQAANTAAFATQKPQITTIDESVRNIGLRTVRNIAASIGIVETFASAAMDGVSLVRCWQHSFAVATMMDRLCSSKDLEGASGYVVGLCHDLAEILLRQSFGLEYKAAVDAAAESGRPLDETLLEVFGMSLSELSKHIFSKLGLPTAITSPIQEFQHWRTSGDELKTPLTCALDIADRYAHGLLLVSTPDARVGPIPRSVMEKITSGEAFSIDNQSLRNEVVATTSLLAKPTAAEQTALLQPLLAPTGARIWYVRHGSYDAVDPLYAALEMLGKPQVHENLPTCVEDLRGYQGVVVVPPEVAESYQSRLAKLQHETGVPILCLAPPAGQASRENPAEPAFVGRQVSLRTLHASLSAMAERTQTAAGKAA